MVNRESQFARKAPDYRNVGHTRRATAVLQEHRHGTDLSRCEGQGIDGVVKPAEIQTRPRTEAGLTRPDRTVCTCVLFVRSDDGKRDQERQQASCATRDWLSEEISASSEFRQKRTHQCTRSTVPRAARRNQDSKSARGEVSSVVEWSRGPVDWALVVGANGTQSTDSP